MTINCEQTVDCIVTFLKEKIKESHKEGICLGISGGIDSAVVAALAVKATEDPSKVHGLHLPDFYSQKKFSRLSQQLADQLQIHFQMIHIGQQVKEQGGYKPFVIKIFRMSAWLNRLIAGLFCRVYSFVKWRNRMIKKNADKKKGLQKALTITHSLSQIMPMPDRIASSFSIRHILRREILEVYAAKRNLLLVGAANRTESFVGWFVENGVDDLPIEPIFRLYKNQVFQLARFLNIPAEIVAMSPSPDMLKGIRDTDIIGFSYDKLDRVAYVIEHGLNKEKALMEGIKLNELRDIAKLNQFSLKMHKNKHEFPSLNQKNAHQK
ncbi:NAD(+) synthase [bacterium]|nr:NAD(+) synthase [bacterium]